MIITINTKEDSKEEIKRVIQMLMKLIEDSPSSQEGFAPVANEGIFGLFDNPHSETPQQDNKEPEDRIEIYDY